MFVPKRLTSFISLPSFNMVPEGDEGGGGSGGAGTTTENTTTGGAGNGGEGKGKEEFVSKADHDRALADMHKYKKAAQTAKEERDAEKLQQMKEKEQWKEIAAQKEQEATDAKANAERIQSSFLSEKKFSAVRAKCEALGLRPEAMSDLEMLDLEDVAIETTSTGKINVLNADKFADKLKSLKPHWFQDKSTSHVNTKGARVVDTNGEITVAALMAAEKEANKSGDRSVYTEMVKKFQQQRLAKR